MRSTFNQYHSEEYTITSAISIESENREEEEDLFNINKWRFGEMQEKVDELTRYLERPVLVLVDETANDAFEYPTLARIAFNVFSIPSMSVEPERVFSGYVLVHEKRLIKAAI